MKGWVTINTDAGFYHREKIGAYAYWIKSDGLFLRGSGVFKDQCQNPLDAELKAMINALHILIGTGRTDFTKIIFNRDNIGAKSGKRTGGNHALLHSKLQSFRKICNHWGTGFYEFRHVKAHVEITSARSYVNDWLDQQCKQELRNFKNAINDKETDQH